MTTQPMSARSGGSADRLYDLLPAAVQLRDELEGGSLRALLQVIAGQVAVVEDDLGELYENWFVETAQDWVVPYLGDLLGYRPDSTPGQLATAAPPESRVLAPRRAVAGLIAANRRKGTLALLEDLAAEVAGWPARAVEFARLLQVFAHVNHQYPDRGRVPDVHDTEVLDRLGGPFETTAHAADVRRISAPLSPGRYNIPDVGVFVWRLKSYPVTGAPAACIEEVSPSSFTFSALGNDAPLFARPDPEPAETTIAGERNLPVPIRRLALARDLAAYYGPGRGFSIEVGARRPVPIDQLVVADLADWRYVVRRGTVAVDPVLGRLAFPSGRPPHGVWVSYRYGFSSDIGAGEYPRRLARPGPGTFYQAVRKATGARTRSAAEVDTIEEALRRWDAVRAKQPVAVVEILDSEVYTERLDVTLRRGERLEIRAADRTRPMIHLLDRLRNAADAFTIRADRSDEDAGDEDGGGYGGGDEYNDESDHGAGGYGTEGGSESGSPGTPEPPDHPAPPKPGGCVRLDGLLISGRAVHVEGPLQRVELVGCTLLPGWGLHADCSPRRPAEPSLEIYLTQALVRIERSIVGSIQVFQDDDKSDPVRLELCDSIVDATSDRREAIGAPNWPLAHAAVTIRRCTVIGEVQAHTLTLAENSIFTGAIRVGRRQTGCVRYCYVTPGSRTPRRYRCQPDLAVAEGTAADAVRSRPVLVSRLAGDPGYARLALDCAAEIVRGADDESEMGAFHDLFQPQRLAGLTARLAASTPARTDIAVPLEN